MSLKLRLSEYQNEFLKTFPDNLLERFGVNEPILLEEILSACSDVTEDAVYRRIRNAIAHGALVKKQRGVYFLPARAGAAPEDLPDESVLVKKYLRCGEEVYGYVAGDALRREIGLPAQDASVVEIVTNREKSRRRSIGAYAGYRDVVLRASRVEVGAENVDALRALDLLTAVDPSSIDDGGRARLAAFLSRASVELLRANVRHFPAKTSKRLLEAEALGLLG